MYTYGSVSLANDSSSHLLGSHWEDPRKTKKLTRKWTATLMLLAAVFISASVMYYGWTSRAADVFSVEKSAIKEVDNEQQDDTAEGGGGAVTKNKAAAASEEAAGEWITGLSFIVYNDYTKETPITWTTKWSHLAEPYRTTYLEAICETDEVPACDEDDKFYWMIGDEQVVGSSRKISYEFVLTGLQYVTVIHEKTVGGQIQQRRQAAGQIMVKYVRREIRTLTDVDRNRFLDALEIMYRLEADDGIRIYGDKYLPMSYFISMHLNGAGVKECDGWHDDAGIVTNHVGVTLAVEQALQVIDPGISIPYWDHTIDAELSTDDTLKESEIFRPDWFGANAPDNVNEELKHVVTEGRWAFTPVLKHAYDHVHNPYGLLRSPWNTSPIPFLQRSDKTNGNVGFPPPTCHDFKLCFLRGSFAEMQNCLNGGTHGPVHILIGGEWGLGDDERELLRDLKIEGNHPLQFKTLWRMGFMRVPEDCTGTQGQQCVTTCPEAILKAHGLSAYDVLLAADQFKWIASQEGTPVYWDEESGRYTFSGMEDDENALNDTWKALLRMLCTTGTVGEMYTSAAPQDPTFWIIHPSMERFLGQKFLTTVPGDSWDRSWGYLHQNDPGDDGNTCDWSNMTRYTDLPICRKAVCYGHHEMDVRPFALTLNGETRFLTNRQILDLVVPEGDDLPYMYDNYFWPACAAQGIFFD